MPDEAVRQPVWSPRDTPPPLPDAVLDVWFASLALPEKTVAACRRLLAPDEAERSRRFHFAEDARRYVLARGILRRLLGAYLDQPPDSVGLTYGPHGKPTLATIGAKALQFNLSHSAGAALYAFVWRHAVGVDLERVRQLDQMDGVARRFFSDREWAIYNGLAAPERPAAFFRCWTRKEAFIKATGAGLSQPLQAFDVTLAPGQDARLERIAGSPTEAARWRLFGLQPAPGLIGAAAVAGPVTGIRCWRWRAGR